MDKKSFNLHFFENHPVTHVPFRYRLFADIGRGIAWAGFWIGAGLAAGCWLAGL